MINIFSFFIRDAYCYSQLIVNQIYVSIPLLLYSHLPTAIVSLVVGSFLLLKNKKLETKIFFFLTLTFFLFTLGDLTEWFVFFGRGTIIFARSIIELADPALFVLSLYFLFVLLKKRDVGFLYKIIWLVPIVAYASTLVYSYSKNLISYNWDICEVSESSIVATYGFYMDLFYLVSGVIFASWSVIRGKGNRKEISIISVGICLFMGVFFSMEYIFTGFIFGGVFNYNYFLYAFFGMPILIIFLAYLIIKYKTFETKLIPSEIFVIGIFSLIFFQYFFLDNTVAIILNTVSLIFATVLSGILIRNVKKEIRQEEELLKLTIDLQNVIRQRESLMHLINHKVKGSFTRTKYIFAALLDGMFGEISPEVKKVSQTGLDSDVMGIRTVDLILNAANLQKGTINYEMKEVDLKKIVLDTAGEKKDAISKKGLELETKIEEGEYKVVGDAFWLKEVVNNLIENALDYTKEGKIMIWLEKIPASAGGGNKILFSIKDTGVGITEEDKKNLFTEGGRGKESVKTNVNSTGYGLYSVKLIVEAHKGKVWVESEGAGYGSVFYVEFDAI